MRKAALLVLFIVLTSLIMVPHVGAAQEFYFSFDTQKWYVLTPNDSWTQSWNDNFTLQKTYVLQSTTGVYWSFLYVKVTHNDTSGNNNYCERRVMVKVYADDRYVTFKTIQAVFYDGVMEFYMPIRLDNPAKNFKIEIWSSTGDGATIQYTVKEIRVLAVNDKGYAIDTYHLGPYTPPQGATGSTAGLLLNKTKADLQQTVSLPVGSLRFWIKWDGTKPLKILDTVGIDEDGQLYVLAGGTKYVVGTIPQDKWTVVGFAWKEDSAYVATASTMNADNATVVQLTNWNGPFEFSQVGDINQTSSSVVDEVAVWDEYIDTDSIFAVNSKVLLKLEIGDKQVPVYPEGGSYLPTPLTISYYGANDTFIDYTTWYGTEQVIQVPSGTEKIILTGNGVSAAYLVSTIGSEMAFPAKDSTLVLEKVLIVPSTPGILMVKNARDQLIFSENISSSATVAGSTGGMYYISFKDSSGVVRAAGWFTFTGNGITLVLSSNILGEKGRFADAWWDADQHAVKVQYVDDKHETNELNITVEFYYKGKLIGAFPITEHTNYYTGTFFPPSIADFARVTVTTDVGYSKTVGVVVNYGGTGFVPDSLFPTSLIMGLFAIGGLLIAPARFKFLAPTIATFILVFAKLAGIFDSPAWLVSAFTGLSILSLIIYRPSSRRGVV